MHRPSRNLDPRLSGSVVSSWVGSGRTTDFCGPSKALLWLRLGRGRCTPSQPIAAGCRPAIPVPGAPPRAPHTASTHGSIHGSNRLATPTHIHTYNHQGGRVGNPKSAYSAAAAGTPITAAACTSAHAAANREIPSAIVSPIASRIRRMQKAGACVTRASRCIPHSCSPSLGTRSLRTRPGAACLVPLPRTSPRPPRRQTPLV